MTNPPLLVVSCDRYADVWPQFFYVLKKRWPDCPFPLFLGSNNLIFSDPSVKTINVGQDLSWASGLKSMLNQLESSHIILFLEDFFLIENVDTLYINRLVDLAIKENVGCLRLAPLPPPSQLPKEQFLNYQDIGIVKPGTPYRVSAQPAIWKKDVLMKFLIPGFSPWEFEHLGTMMSEEMPEIFLGPLVPYILYDHGIEKGKWKPAGIEICREAGIEPDLTSRGSFSLEELKNYYEGQKGISKIPKMKESAILNFVEGDKLSGIRQVIQFIRLQPFSIQPWAILFFGILGSGPLRWLRKKHLEQKIKCIKAKQPEFV